MNKIELQVQQTVRLDVALKLGSVEVALEVTGTAPMINITDATVGTVIDNKQILELPLIAGSHREPGVQSDTFACAGPSSFGPAQYWRIASVSTNARHTFSGVVAR